MEKFSAEEFYRIARFLELSSHDPLDLKAIDRLGSLNVGDSCQRLGLRLSLKQVERFHEAVAASGSRGIPSPDFVFMVKSIQERIQDEMSDKLFLHISEEDAAFYEGSDNLFPEIVRSKWPNLAEDASEASKCYALGRYTACVFHLMRVTEFGVQQFGTLLGVKLAEDLRWQTILDQANKTVKAMDQKLPRTRALSETSVYLYHVKAAWRNEVMHPKATYTREEAKVIIDAVKAFMAGLAQLA